MLKLMKYLKKSILPILAVVVLLVLQAVCDLSLPSYTADIVDVGIQQGGITSSAPEVMREGTFQSVMLFVPQADKEFVEGSYTRLAKDELSESDYNKYQKKYPILSTETVYMLKDLHETDRSRLETVMEQPMMFLLFFNTESETSDLVKEKMFQNLPESMQDMSMMDIIKAMPQEQLDAMIAGISEQMAGMTSLMSGQSAIAGVKAEYEAIGMNMSKIQTNYIVLTGLKMLALALLIMASTITVGFLASRIAASFGRDVRAAVFHKVVGFSNTEFDRFSTASLITRSTNDIQQVQMLIVMLLRIVLYAPIVGIGGVIKVLNTNTSMAWIIGVAVVIIIMLVGTLFIIAMPKFKLLQKLVDKLNLVTREILTGLSVIRAFSTEKHEEKRFDVANRDLTKTSLFVNRVMTFMMPAMMFIMNGIAVLILWNGASGIDTGSMQVGDLMAFIQYTMQIIMAFLMICMISIMLPRAAVSGSRITEILETTYAINDPDQKKSFDSRKKGYVEFDHVSFRYPGADENVLEDLTFTAKPGETTAIIGSTGSGKSTLVNLIPRFYDVTEGRITVDGADIREVSQKELRDRLGFVPQKGVLFTGTIDSNLRYGKEDASREEIEKAARIAQAKSFIEEKPDGYQSDIAQGGSNVSGGQKQRLSIARAIAKNPEIYVFDDSFSALDFKTDVALRKAIKSEISESTIIIVAQRISTILNAEQILVLDDGRIVGKGTHSELMKSCEVYRQIAASQLSAKELEEQSGGLKAAAEGGM